ncbi:MAG TPA: NrfD/PsrC family molybdoenzyme membrane anchor subunit [Jatrophihabitans sp.]|nr:NrfD/PsrC family molybdoenzyme membrane anchor subunit [Jatrophihabitans sp.]
MSTLEDGRRRIRRRGRRGEQPMVPDVEFTSYYGRPILKPSPWAEDIPAYLFFGGLAGGSALLGAGADLTDRPVLRRRARLTALGAIGVSLVALVHDLGRPARFLNMLRVAKPTSPMSIGTWILSAFGPFVGLAAAAEFPRLAPRPLRGLLRRAGRPAGLTAAVIAPAVASYTAVLLSDTATPTWHESYRELPFVFVGSASMASGGMGMLVAPVDEAGPARRMAVGGALLDLAAIQKMESSAGIAAETLHKGRAGVLMRLGKSLTAAGLLGTALGGRDRRVAAAAGLALLGGSACGRFGVFYAGQESAADPKYTVVPQRERVAGRS